MDFSKNEETLTKDNVKPLKKVGRKWGKEANGIRKRETC
jgi:hypothetical protein